MRGDCTRWRHRAWKAREAEPDLEIERGYEQKGSHRDARCMGRESDRTERRHMHRKRKTIT
eukprot:14533814-Alexandrium_andersonii.AAC.1